jgi:hypothetical protein
VIVELRERLPEGPHMSDADNQKEQAKEKAARRALRAAAAAQASYILSVRAA